MNFKTTGILLVLLLIVGGVWLLFPKQETTQEESAAPTTPTETAEYVFDPRPENDRVVQVVVERPGKPRLVFARAPKEGESDALGPWEAREPLAVPIQTYTVDGLVSTLTSLRSQKRFEPGEGGPSPADAGLEPPVATVTLVDRDGKAYKLEIGKKAAISNDTYVRRAGETTIHVVARDLGPQVKKDFNEYRDKRLCPLVTSDVRRVEFASQGRTVTLTRGTGQEWVIDTPIKAYAQREQVMALIRKISGLRVETFVAQESENLAGYGLSEPFLTVRVTTEKKKKVTPPEDESSTQPAEPQYETVTEQHTLEIGGYADLDHKQRFARRPDQGTIAVVKQADVEGLIPDLGKLRDPLITRVKVEDVTRLELHADGQSAALEKVEGTWRGVGDLAELETEAVEDLLDAFANLRAIEYIEQPGNMAEYGLAQPRAVVSVTVGGAVAPITVRVGGLTRSARNAYVSLAGQPTVFVVSADQANRLAIPPLSLRSRRMFDADEDQFQWVEVNRNGRRYRLVRDEKRWRLAEPAEAPIDLTAARTLVGDLSRLRARRVVAKGNEARYGLDRSDVIIRFAVQPELEGPPPPEETTTAPSATQPGTAPASTQPATQPAAEPVVHVLRVARRETVAYARLDDLPYVFELDDTIYRVLTGELIRRKLFDFSVKDITGVTIVKPGETLEFTEEKGQWRFTPDPYVKLKQDKVKGLLTRLAALQVQRYEQYRDADLKSAGLFTAPITISIRLSGDRMANLKLEPKRTDGGARLAGWVEKRCTFRLSETDCVQLLRGLDAYLDTGQDKSGDDRED